MGAAGEAQFTTEGEAVAAPSPGEPDLCPTLEREGLVRLPNLVFRLTANELDLTGSDLGQRKAKNVSYDPRTGRLGGVELDAATTARFTALLARFSAWARDLLAQNFGRYAPDLEVGRTSYRPRPVDEERPSPRKDDRRLHVDAFPSQPVAGRRILRVFSNIDPTGHDREWAVGEPFEAHARRFMHRARALLPGEGGVLQALRITKGRRTAYDQLMLQLHDLSKLDAAYQAWAPRRHVSFAPGATWVVFTDQVPHAALKGQYALEQTFYVPLEALAQPEVSPLRVLERLSGRRLV
ncbi:MAG: Kdo hydroxylase family protein [Caulobacterales bacterium]